MNMIFLGAPGAGKGTHAARVAERLSIPTISTGALLRAAIAEGSELGKEAERHMQGGNFAPDELVLGIVKERIAKEDCKNGFILDGFPRSVKQAEALDALGVKIDCVLNLHVEDEAIIDRMSGRRICTKCGATYHVEFNPTKDGLHCDECPGILAMREDDKPEIVKARLVIYHEKTAPLIEYYQKRGILKTVEGRKNLEKTAAAVFEALGI
ncbi:MAG: adenylate kinase [Clostridia bacterium]|nr:adenylate kinase [Clostridia bacterium]